VGGKKSGDVVTTFCDRLHKIVKPVHWLHTECVLNITEVNVEVNDDRRFAASK
jgi:hypothetical protein